MVNTFNKNHNIVVRYERGETMIKDYPVVRIDESFLLTLMKKGEVQDVKSNDMATDKGQNESNGVQKGK